jgi:hypothetical protein
VRNAIHIGLWLSSAYLIVALYPPPRSR